MKKSILISIQPKWCELIASGKKTVEVRKTKPKLETPFKCYIYCTNTKTLGDFILCKSEENAKLFGYNTAKGINKGFAQTEDVQLKGKVIGEFVCDDIVVDEKGENSDILRFYGNLTHEEIWEYGRNKTIYGWHITDLVIYENPRELSEFYTLKKCSSCKSGYESTACIYDEDCKVPVDITRPPQSWCYVE